jgi:hypothetical protein
MRSWCPPPFNEAQAFRRYTAFERALDEPTLCGCQAILTAVLGFEKDNLIATPCDHIRAGKGSGVSSLAYPLQQ